MADPASTDHLPFVTVAIGTYNRARWLKEAITFIIAQDYPLDRWDFIIVDNKCTDNTREVVESFGGARKAPRYFFEANPGSSYARNRALAEMSPSTDIVLFTDDDVIGRSDWLRQMIEPLQRPGQEKVAGVCGETIPHFPDGLPRWMEGTFSAFNYRKDIGPLTPKQLPSTANVALRKSVLDEVGGFRTDLGRLPNKLTAGEDNDLMRRILAAGYTFWFNPKADILHVVPAGRLTFKYARKLQFDASCSRVVERSGRSGFYPWAVSRVFLNLLQIILCSVIGGLAALFGQMDSAKRWIVRVWRAGGYVREGIRVMKRKALGQTVDVHS